MQRMVGAYDALFVNVDVKVLGERSAADPGAAPVGCGDEHVGPIVAEVTDWRPEPKRSVDPVLWAKEDRDAPVRQREDHSDARTGCLRQRGRAVPAALNQMRMAYLEARAAGGAAAAPG